VLDHQPIEVIMISLNEVENIYKVTHGMTADYDRKTRSKYSKQRRADVITMKDDLNLTFAEIALRTGISGGHCYKIYRSKGKL
jgi:hypothetical protein